MGMAYLLADRVAVGKDCYFVDRADLTEGKGHYFQDMADLFADRASYFADKDYFEQHLADKADLMVDIEHLKEDRADLLTDRVNLLNDMADLTVGKVHLLMNMADLIGMVHLEDNKADYFCYFLQKILKKLPQIQKDINHQVQTGRHC